MVFLFGRSRVMSPSGQFLCTTLKKHLIHCGEVFRLANYSVVSLVHNNLIVRQYLVLTVTHVPVKARHDIQRIIRVQSKSFKMHPVSFGSLSLSSPCTGIPSNTSKSLSLGVSTCRPRFGIRVVDDPSQVVLTLGARCLQGHVRSSILDMTHLRTLFLQ